MGARSSERYLDLLKAVLTDTLFESGPDPDVLSPANYVQSLVEHCIRGRALTMVPISRLNNIQRCIEDVITNDVPGDLLEAGVWRGGTAVFMRAALAAHNCEDRRLWVADSFEGLAKPDPALHPIEAKAHESKLMKDVYHHFAVSLDEVQSNFSRLGLLDARVRFLKGWFKDTLPSAPIERLAVMRLDGDLYESTMDALVSLYPKLSPGGFAIIDDYNAVESCNEAVHDFLNERGIGARLTAIEGEGAFWRKD